jgi:hypothetical protein
MRCTTGENCAGIEVLESFGGQVNFPVVYGKDVVEEEEFQMLVELLKLINLGICLAGRGLFAVYGILGSQVIQGRIDQRVKIFNFATVDTGTIL